MTIGQKRRRVALVVTITNNQEKSRLL